jgi:microcystin-dependent protein
MAASNTDKFKKAKRRFSTTIDVGGTTSGATTIALVSTSGLDTDTAITLVLDPGLATEEVITGVVSGSNIINCVRGKEGTTAQAHTAGAAVAMYFTETHWDDLIDGVLAEHNQNGTHGAITATSITATTASVTNLNVGGASLVPAGSIMQYAGSAAPTGWLLADGSAVSRTTYATLFTAISTTYGTGDGSTTFNLPNLKGKVPVGRDSADTAFDVLGETGGAKTVDVSHSHTANSAGSHSHGGATDRAIYQAGQASNVLTSSSADTPPGHNHAIATDGAHTHSTTTSLSATQSVLQPYVVLNYIIKT